jgi:hypothetical protein
MGQSGAPTIDRESKPGGETQLGIRIDGDYRSQAVANYEIDSIPGVNAE